MSVDDPENKPLNQTRFGKPTGHANERQMLDSRNDTFGIRTIIRKNSEGSDTICRTHAGMPRFFTEDKHDSPEPIDPSCPLTDVGFVNSYYSVGAYPASERFDWKLYTLFDGSGVVKKAKYARNTTGKKDQLMRYAAPLFSGLMRRVIQLQNGKSDEGIQLYPGWETTDGLFIGVGEYGKPTRYVIRIDDTGVWRIPISFCKDLKPTWEADESEWLSSLSEQAAHDKISPYWTVKKLHIDQKVMIGDAPPCFSDGFAPFYEWCGWAFNYTGTSATVVCTGVKSAGDSWLTNRMYDVTIRSSYGIPDAATTALVEEAMFDNPYNDGLSGASNAALQAATILPGYLQTYQFFNPPAGAVTQDAPVFSYYEKAGGKTVVRYKYVAGESFLETRTSVFQEPVPCYQTPVGTFESTTAISGTPTVVAVDVYPEGAFDTYSFGKVYESLSGGTAGTFGPCMYSGEVPVVGETNSTPAKIEFELEAAGFGYTQNYSDKSAGRSALERTIWCVTGASVYGPDKPVYPWAGPPGGTSPDPFGQTQQVGYVWQKVTTYAESNTEKSCLILHGFDRESYAVAVSKTKYTGIKTIGGDTSGSFAGFTFSPEEASSLLVSIDGNPTKTTFSPSGIVVMDNTGEEAVNAIGGWALLPSPIGKVVCRPGIKSIGGMGTTTIPESTQSTTTLHTIAGGVTKTTSLTTGNLLKNYVSGDLFLFRACSAAWRSGRIVRSTDANSPLVTDNLGGVAPTSNITTFIGVF